MPSMLTTLCAWRGATLKCEHYPKLAVTPKRPFRIKSHLASTCCQSLMLGLKYNIKTISQVPVITNQSLIPLPLLSPTYNIPVSYYFRYLQFSHAFRCQFPQSAPQVIQSALEDVLRSECSTSHLTTISLPAMEGFRARWSQDIPELDYDDWDDVWDFPFRSLVSLSDHLIQFKMVYRSYYRLHKMSSTCSPGVLEVWRSPWRFLHVIFGPVRYPTNSVKCCL